MPGCPKKSECINMSIIGEIQCEQKLIEENKKTLPFSPDYMEGYKSALDWVYKRILENKRNGTE